MRHIKFEESTIMRELARIAQEQGLIKTAEVEIPSTKPEPVQPGTDPEFNRILSKYPDVNAVYKGAFQNVDGAKLFDSLKLFTNELAVELPKVVRSRLMQPLVQNVRKFYAGKLKPQDQSRIENVLMTAMASADEDVVKTADGKLYELFSETGEDLVEKAHPGGGTETELTHSKTKENLVETIVEQQEKDIEVAQKAPNGTYATLIELYSKLSKLGFESKLDVLKNAISTVASPEVVLEHTLLVLSDELDRLGYTKHADFVDGLLKKKAENPRAKQFLDALNTNIAELKQYESWSEGSRDHSKYVLEQLKRVSPDMTLTQAVNQSRALLNEWQKSPLYTYLNAVHTTLQNQFKDSLAQEQTELGPKQEQMRQQLSGRKVQMGPVTVSPSGKFNAPLDKGGTQAVQKWQYLYNKKHKGNLREDGIWGPETQKAYESTKPKSETVTEKSIPSPLEGLEGAQKKELVMRPQDAEALMIQKLQGRFGRLPLNRVPELVDALKTQAKELLSAGYNPDELLKQFDALVGRLTTEDVKKYIR